MNSRRTVRPKRIKRSHERRRTIKAVIESVPVPVLRTVLHERFISLGDADFQAKLLSAVPTPKTDPAARASGRDQAPAVTG